MINKEELSSIFNNLINLDEWGQLLGVEIFVSHHAGGTVPPKLESFKLGDISDAKIVATAQQNQKKDLSATLERLEKLNPKEADKLKAEFSKFGNN